MRHKNRRVGPVSRQEPIKRCSSITCLTPNRGSGKSPIHDKFKRNKDDNSEPDVDQSDTLLFPKFH